MDKFGDAYTHAAARGWYGQTERNRGPSWHWHRTTSRISTSTRSSAFSTASGASRTWSAQASAQGFDSLALTDHGALYGAVAFYQACATRGIKPIIGVETYVARRSMTDREGKADAQPYHLILLAKDWTGYRNLCRIVTDAHLDGYYYKPRIDRDYLAQHAEGLIGLSACLNGEIPRALEIEDWDRARRLAGDLRRHLRPGQLLPRAPGPRPAGAAAPERAAAPPRAGGRPAARRHERPALRPQDAGRGARRAALRRHGLQPRHAGPDALRDAGVLPEERGRDGGALPRTSRRRSATRGGSPR